MEGIDGSSLGRSHALFEFGPGLFDRIEVRRVGRQIEQGCPASLDTLAHAVDLVSAEIVHHEHMTGAQFWAEHVVEISEEHLAICGRLDGHGGEHAGVVHRAQDGQHFPVAARHGIVDAMSSRSTGIGAGHLCRNTAFIHINQVFRRDLIDLPEELFALLPVGFRIAFEGVK